MFLAKELKEANYIVSMIAEDMIGNKDTLHGVDPSNRKYYLEFRGSCRQK